MSIAMADALMGIFGLRRVEMKMICPKAKRCNGCADIKDKYSHAIPHSKKPSCAEGGSHCPACVPVKAKRKGKK